MESWARLSWLCLAALHVPPAAVAVVPDLAERLYGVSLDKEVGVLVVHRGALFLGVVVLASWAAFDPRARRLATLMLTLSIVGFLIVYARAGWPPGPLRTIAVADGLALLPLGLVSLMAWRGPTGTPT